MARLWSTRVLALAALVACAEEASPPALPQPAPPVLAVAPALLDFGHVLLESSSELPLVVSNPGGGTLAGSVLASGPFSIAGPSDYALGPGESAELVVRFAPTAPGPAAETLAFDGAAVTLQGSGAAIGVAPGALDFGAVAMDE